MIRVHPNEFAGVDIDAAEQRHLLAEHRVKPTVLCLYDSLHCAFSFWGIGANLGYRGGEVKRRDRHGSQHELPAFVIRVCPRFTQTDLALRTPCVAVLPKPLRQPRVQRARRPCWLPLSCHCVNSVVADAKHVTSQPAVVGTLERPGMHFALAAWAKQDAHVDSWSRRCATSRSRRESRGDLPCLTLFSLVESRASARELSSSANSVSVVD